MVCERLILLTHTGSSFDLRLIRDETPVCLLRRQYTYGADKPINDRLNDRLLGAEQPHGTRETIPEAHTDLFLSFVRTSLMITFSSYAHLPFYMLFTSSSLTEERPYERVVSSPLSQVLKKVHNLR